VLVQGSLLAFMTSFSLHCELYSVESYAVLKL